MSEFLNAFSQIFPPLSRTQSILLIIILIPTLITLISGAPWVPTPTNRVRKMLQLAKLKKGARVYDLGCGDGRLVHLASREHRARATGLEFAPVIYAMAKCIQPFQWLKGSRAEIKFRNFYKVDLSDANVIVCYLLPFSMNKLRAKFERELTPGTKIISYAFKMDGWEPIHRERRIRKKAYGPIWIYEIGKSNPSK